MSSLPTVVFLHPNDGCLTAARALVRRGVEVHLLATPEYRYVLASRGVHGRVMPDMRVAPQEWLDELVGIGDGVVLCGSDAASQWVTEHRSELPTSLRTFESGDEVHVGLMDKQTLYATANEAGVRAPWMVLVASHTDLEAQLDTVTFPCVVKPTMGHVAKQQLGIGTVAVASRAELVAAAAPLLEHDIAFLLTELVPGPETSLEGSVAVRTRSGEYVLEYGRRKVRQWPLDYGVGSLLESADVPETLAMNRRLMNHTGFVGISACETKRHAETGELYLIEINVRVPASFGLAEAAGTDGAWRLYAALADLPLGPGPEPVTGRKVVLPQKDVQAAVQRIRRREASVGEVLRSWRGVRDSAAWSWRDPRPALAQVRSIIEQRQLARADRPAGTGPGRIGSGATSSKGSAFERCAERVR